MRLISPVSSQQCHVNFEHHQPLVEHSNFWAKPNNKCVSRNSSFFSLNFEGEKKRIEQLCYLSWNVNSPGYRCCSCCSRQIHTAKPASRLMLVFFFPFLFLFPVERANAKWSQRMNCPSCYLRARSWALGLYTKYWILLLIFSQSQKMWFRYYWGRVGKEKNRQVKRKICESSLGKIRADAL